MKDKVLDGTRPESLDLEWNVYYKDGTYLKQNYGKGEKNEEHNFSHIKLDEVNEFRLMNKDGDVFAIVDSDNQEIHINGTVFKVEFPRDKNGKEVKGKLVYFRRIRNDFTPDRGVVQTIKYCIGLQANIDGVNKQQYVFINSDGSFTLSQQK